MHPRRHAIIIVALSLVIYMANIMWVRPAASDSRERPASQTRGRAADPYPAADSNSFTGSAACAKCHKNIYDKHLLTAHFRDSRPASDESIKGSFAKGKNRFTYNSRMDVVMAQKGSLHYQTALFNGLQMESEPFDVVIGSGRKGQTYLYWDGDRLFELPVSYYTPLNTWCVSPGYPTNLVLFNRQIQAQCIECHGTFARAQEEEGKGTVFDKSLFIYGIDCERCHGPGAAHIAFHNAHPGEKTGRYILNAARMSRQQRLDACALCHSGLRTPIQPAFSFAVGDTLDNYSTAAYSEDSVSSLDVHGNQYGLLTASKCFRQSLAMDCSSCHNVHVNEYNNQELFSRRCMNCHNDANHSTCTMPVVRQERLTGNCIDCHMPALPSNKIVLNLSGSDTTRDLVRTHRIGIYLTASQQYLATRRK